MPMTTYDDHFVVDEINARLDMLERTRACDSTPQSSVPAPAVMESTPCEEWRTAPFKPPVNDLILRAARGEATARPPVWLMRQAGRYDPQYQELKKTHTFLEICGTPALAAQVAMQPINSLDVDAAIVFSDILVVPQAMGLELLHGTATGPRFPTPLAGPQDLSRLRPCSEALPALQYVLDAVRCTRHQLDGRVPLLGFAGAPWSLMAYMVQGGGLNGGKADAFRKAKIWLRTEPVSARELLQQITDLLVAFLIAQVENGAQMLQLFDSHAGELGPTLFQQFEVPYLIQIAERVKAECPEVPLCLFAKGASFGFKHLAESKFDIFGVDWKTDPQYAREQLPGKCLQGNLDPNVLYCGEETIKAEVDKMLLEFGGDAHIAGMGDGCEPKMKPEAVLQLVQSVKAHTRS